MDNKFFDAIAFVYGSTITRCSLHAASDPSESYSQLLFVIRIDKKNKIYPIVRRLMVNLRMDEQNISTKHWNPFKDLAKPGRMLVIKPNLITHHHHLGEDNNFDISLLCIEVPILNFRLAKRWE